MVSSVEFRFPELGNIVVEGDSSKVYLPSHYANVFIQCFLDQPIKGKRILDMGCGTGIIGIAAAKLGAQVVCADINKHAVENTRKNAKENGVDCHVVESDGFANIPREKRFDLIVCNAPSNPDYVDQVITPTDNGHDGRKFLDHVLEYGPQYTASGGRLLTCSGSEQNWEKTASMLTRHWADYRILKDLDEDFSNLNQFTDALLQRWVDEGLCWREDEKIMHSVRYFFAYR